MDTLIPVVVGAVLATLGGVVGAWIQGRREHRHWLRERRYEAYSDLDAALTRLEVKGWAARSGEDSADAAMYAALVDEAVSNDLAPLIARLNLVGPDDVIRAKNVFMDALADPTDKSGIDIASTKFTNSMRTALGIPIG